jgi:hypothetical protein
MPYLRRNTIRKETFNGPRSNLFLKAPELFEQPPAISRY